MYGRRLALLALCAACHHSPARSGGPPVEGPIPSRGCYGGAPVDEEIAHVPGVRASWFNAPSGNERWYVLEAGPAVSSEPPLVLIHGVGALGTADFYPALGALSRSRRVLAIDLPGFGRSSRADRDFGPERLARSVNAVVHACLPGTIDVLGHSSGGALALLFTAEREDVVRRLVLVDVAGVLRPEVLLRGQLHQRFGPTRVAMPIVGKAVEKIGGVVIEALQAFVPSAQSVADTGLLGKSPSVLAATALLDFNFGPAIERIRAPTLILWGERDDVMPPRIAHLLDDRIAQSELVFLPGAGHVPMEDRPEAMAQVVGEYLRRPESPPPAPHAEPPRAARDADCHDRDDMTFTGPFATITIDHCKHVRLDRVRAERVYARHSDGRVDESEIAEGMVVEKSEFSLTGGELRGEIALQTHDSKLDIAGVAITGRKVAILARKSELVLSVTPIKSPHTDAILHRELSLEDEQEL